jgi:hypothetical protein
MHTGPPKFPETSDEMIRNIAQCRRRWFEPRTPWHEPENEWPSGAMLAELFSLNVTEKNGNNTQTEIVYLEETSTDTWKTLLEIAGTYNVFAV